MLYSVDARTVCDSAAIILAQRPLRRRGSYSRYSVPLLQFGKKAEILGQTNCGFWRVADSPFKRTTKSAFWLLYAAR
jgi:hypothetical protein